MAPIRQYSCVSLLLPFMVLLCFRCNCASTATTLRPASVASAKQDPKCLLPLEAGPCRMSLERFYYNSQTNSCETFKFGGCRGNDNRFGFRKTCENACLRPTPTSATGTDTAKISTSSSTPLPAIAAVTPTVRAVAATTEMPKTVLVTG